MACLHFRTKEIFTFMEKFVALREYRDNWIVKSTSREYIPHSYCSEKYAIAKARWLNSFRHRLCLMLGSSIAAISVCPAIAWGWVLVAANPFLIYPCGRFWTKYVAPRRKELMERSEWNEFETLAKSSGIQPSKYVGSGGWPMADKHEGTGGAGGPNSNGLRTLSLR